MKTIYMAFDGKQFDNENDCAEYEKENCAEYEKEKGIENSSISLFDITGEPFDPKRIMGAEDKSLIELVEYANYICFDKKDYSRVVNVLLDCYDYYFEETDLLEENNIVYYDVTREGYVLLHQKVEYLRQLFNMLENNMNTILEHRKEKKRKEV